MADTFKGIITADGKKRQLPYSAVWETPVSDETLSIQGAFADAKVVGDNFKKTKAETDSLKEDISNKITKLYASSQGETHITDSDNGKIQDMMIYGKSSQDGTPTPENPVEIKSVVNPTVKVCGKNLAGLWKQGLLSTDDGKKIIANNYWVNTKEYVKISVNNYAFSSDSTCRALIYEYDRDKKYIGAMQLLTGVKSTIYVPNSKCAYIKFGYNYDGSKEAITPDEMGAKHWLQLELGSTATSYQPYTEQTAALPYTLNAIPVESGGNVAIDGQKYIADYVDVEREKLVRMVDSSKLDNTQSIVDKTESLLAAPQEIDLTTEEITAFKALATYYPTTHISVTSEQLDGYTVFNYPISMANGWNYVKKQLNDNRDYIYDMDIQSAEAYVNSEYAVALTELEV